MSVKKKRIIENIFKGKYSLVVNLDYEWINLL